ncbi:MAG: L-aspartate oxidase [Actinomycetota bacterium]|nr:L-aspartate oxidase [Actinomycetota bacterium]
MSAGHATDHRGLVRRLAAPAPGWTVRADVVVIGSGIAGLTTALKARRAGRVLLVTKTELDAGSTRWAQGGIAAALGPEDTPDQHLTDTLVAGAGLCDETAVRVLVTEGPDLVRELVDLGANFDLDHAGDLALTREGGHLRRRIAHAGGDATGAEIERALIVAVKATEGIEIIEHALVLDLLKTADGRACGVTLHVIGEGRRDGVGAALGRAVVLATGGLGQIFASTTNPPVATGDGVALALRAGAEVTDLEFVQFHPTVLWLGPGAVGQQPLISEAVRGEGAVLVDVTGNRFMVGQHPMAELAPRYVVAQAIVRQLRATGADHVLLDARGVADFAERFPTITASCRAHGIDPVTMPIPVVPGAHHASGGVRTDLVGRTNVPGLYACGEVACTGVHGANRLASNSLLEGLVFAARIADELTHALPPPTEPAADPRASGLLGASASIGVQAAMTAGAGVLRTAQSLDATAAALAAVAAGATAVSAGSVVSAGTDAEQPCVEAWQATNLHAVATALVTGARLRAETRGSHWREDYPEASPDWLGHLVTTLDARGALTTVLELTGEPGPAEEAALAAHGLGSAGPA